MDRDKKAYLKDRELTEADRVVLGLYERAAESIEWDDSDEAILTLARSIHAEDEGKDQSGSLAADAADSPADNQDLAHAAETDEEDGGANVVAFAPRKRPAVGRAFYRSPVAGFSIAASLMIGIFAGQGLTPYVNLGLAPDYDKIMEENQQLTRSLSAQMAETPTGSRSLNRAPALRPRAPGLVASSYGFAERDGTAGWQRPQTAPTEKGRPAGVR